MILTILNIFFPGSALFWRKQHIQGILYLLSCGILAEFRQEIGAIWAIYAIILAQIHFHKIRKLEKFRSFGLPAKIILWSSLAIVIVLYTYLYGPSWSYNGSITRPVLFYFVVNFSLTIPTVLLCHFLSPKSYLNSNGTDKAISSNKTIDTNPTAEKKIDEEFLEKKAEIAAEIVLSNSHKMASEFKELFNSINLVKLFFESLIINLHFFDRFAFRFIGPQNRNIFMDYLYLEITPSIIERVKDPDKIEETIGKFFEIYHKRQQQYATFDIVAEKNDRGGHDVENTLGWKFSELLTGKDALFYGVQAGLLISHYYVETAKGANIKDFFYKK